MEADLVNFGSERETEKENKTKQNPPLITRNDRATLSVCAV